MEKWLRDGLSNCLDFEVPDDMIKYIMSLKNSEEFDDYFGTLLNKECDDHRLFLTDCKQRLFSKALPNKKPPPQQSKKTPASGTNIKQNTNNNKQTNAAVQQSQQQNKKKTKFVNLYATDGKVVTDTILLKGRRPCDCQAAQHNLINNCLGCGRIVCVQEGSGPCLFCGEIVCTNEEMQVLKGTNKKSQQLLKSLKEQGGGVGEGLHKALEQRDRLLEYDRNSEKRTTVIDDELDYFQENSVWLSKAEREKFERMQQEMREKKHASRAKRAVKVDFAGRVIDDENQLGAEYERKMLEEIASISLGHDGSNWSNRQHGSHAEADIDPNSDTMRPLFRITKEGREFAKSQPQIDGLERSYNRVQDKELLEMQDMRHCLSMHQPWASLLVAGIKKHEGRVWYSEHRGRLWIAATVKQPHPDEIKELENFYKNLYNDPDLKFPEHYPTGCLLGCVKVEDCMPQEEYRDKYPKGESDSPYVFVCSNPEQLSVVFPIKGEQKIYQIDPKIHNAACRTLLRSRAMKT